MKLRVLFLKKKSIIYLLIILLLMFLFSFLFIQTSSEAFNVAETNSIKADLDGDGEEDTLYVKNDNNKYYIEVKTKDKTYNLDPDKDINTLGEYSKYWPLRINLVDISRDKTPEIFIQSSYKDNPLQHIFYWNGEKFENIFSSSNSIIGFNDYSSNKTTKVISGNILKDNISMKNYIYSNGKFYSYSCNYINAFEGRDSVLSFINYIQSLPSGEAIRPNEILDPEISGKSIAAIGTLSGENNKYIFQDGLFMDTKFDKKGDVSEIKWALNFRGVSNLNKDNIRNYNIILLLKPTKTSSDSFLYKISSISINKVGPQ